jgi:hypothetical protein
MMGILILCIGLFALYITYFGMKCFIQQYYSHGIVSVITGSILWICFVMLLYYY